MPDVAVGVEAMALPTCVPVLAGCKRPVPLHKGYYAVICERRQVHLWGTTVRIIFLGWVGGVGWLFIYLSALTLLLHFCNISTKSSNLGGHCPSIH